jgi:hypothetical protein
VQTSDRLRSLFLQDHSSKPVILLGAGASVKSGIPLSGEIVERAAKWLYCQSKGLQPDDPGTKRSDWLGWLRGTASTNQRKLQPITTPKQSRIYFSLVRTEETFEWSSAKLETVLMRGYL